MFDMIKIFQGWMIVPVIFARDFSVSAPTAGSNSNEDDSFENGDQFPKSKLGLQ